MSCCKSNNGYKFYLQLNENHDRTVIKTTMQKAFGWNESKIDSIIDIASNTGTCKLFDVGFDEMKRLSRKLAEYKLPYKVIQK